MWVCCVCVSAFHSLSWFQFCCYCRLLVVCILEMILYLNGDFRLWVFCFFFLFFCIPSHIHMCGAVEMVLGRIIYAMMGANPNGKDSNAQCVMFGHASLAKREYLVSEISIRSIFFILYILVFFFLFSNKTDSLLFFSLFFFIFFFWFFHFAVHPTRERELERQMKRKKKERNI